MATDGVKIIDSDTAHDIYWEVVDLYDNGATVEEIKSKIHFPFSNELDDFEYEIFTTAYALAMWEVGYLTEDILREVKIVIDKGVGIRVWTEECDEKTGRKRQNELKKLWDKLNTINNKVRKRKKYKQITSFLFEVNEVLAFQLSNKLYYATVLLSISQYRGYCNYRFGKINYTNGNLPTISEIMDAEIIGRKVPFGQSMDLKKILEIGLEEIKRQGGIQKIMEEEAERTGSYKIGLSSTTVEHKDLIKFVDRFYRIGKLNLKEFEAFGSLASTDNFEGLTRNYLDLENSIKVFEESKFKIKDLIQE